MSKRPLRVRNHRMLIERSGELRKGVQFPQRLFPTAEPIKRQPFELADRTDARRFWGKRAQDPERVLIAVPLVGLRRVCESTLDLCSTSRRDRGDDFPAEFGERLCSSWSTPPTASR